MADRTDGSARHAFARGLETVVERADNGQRLEYLPVRLDSIVTHPSGCTRDGASQRHFYIITLEGTRDP